MTIPIVAVTGYSAFWQTTGDGLAYAQLTTTQGGNRGRTEKIISKFLTRRQEMLPLKALLLALVGAAAGGAASATLQRVDAQATDPSNVTNFNGLGGLRNTTLVTLLSRVTTAADITYIGQILNQRFGQAIASYPTVLGSGGGGKLGAF